MEKKSREIPMEARRTTAATAAAVMVRLRSIVSLSWEMGLKVDAFRLNFYCEFFLLK